MIEKYVCPRDTMTNEILWNLASEFLEELKTLSN